jgi:methyl-accepting chemotaxis protein
MDVSARTTTRASVRFAALELATVVPTVVLWSVVLGAGDLATMFVVFLLRGLVTSLLWVRTLEPARRWHDHGEALDDAELLAIDAAMADAPRRFSRAYALIIAVAQVIGTLLGALGLPRPIPLGGFELVGAVMMLIAIVVIVLVIQMWLWSSLSEARVALGQTLRARKLASRREPTSIVRSQLLLGAATTLAMYLGCFGLGGVVYARAQRSETLAALHHEVELAALRSDEQGVPAEFEVVATPPPLLDVDAPARVDVSLRGSEALAVAPLPDGRWVVGRRSVSEGVGAFIAFVLFVGGALAVPMVGTSLAFAHSMREPLLALGRLSRQVTEQGKVRGIERILSLRTDEIDMISRDFNAMLDVLEELTDAATKVADGDLRISFERPGELHDAFRGMIDRLHGMVVQIRTTALDLASAAAEIHSITHEQARAAEQQSASVQEVSETVASLAGAAENISVTATSVLANADHTLEATRGLIERIDELGRQASGVGELLELIREIADRSDLLALNGSLEATRVGEAGRGFALVAAEMRRLAERVTLAVGDVRVRVGEIKSAGASAVRAADQNRELAEQTAAAARHISQVTQTQSHATDQAAQTVRDVAGVVIASAGATSQTREAAEGLRVQAERLERTTRQFKLRREADDA